MATYRGTGKDFQLPPTFEVFPEEGLVIVTFSRHLSIDDIQSYVAALRAHPSFNPHFSEIVDLTSVEDFSLNPEDALVLADKLDPFSIGSRRAFIARTDSQIHAARMHQILRNDVENTHIFPSFTDAKRWINS